MAGSFAGDFMTSDGRGFMDYLLPLANLRPGCRWSQEVDPRKGPQFPPRNFKIEGERLHVLTPWRVMSNWPELGMQRSILTFERSKR